MKKFGIGQSVPRFEDARLLTGQGRYTDDIHLANEAHACFVRSPHAHARLGRIETAEAIATPSVIAVLIGAEFHQAGLGTIPNMVPLQNKDGSDCIEPPYWPLAVERTRHVGEPVAVVVAESLAQAKDGAERVAVDYQPLPPAVGVVPAIEAGAPQIWDEAPGNLCFDWCLGDEAAVKAAFAQAAHITRLDLVNNRLIVNTVEARCAIAAPREDGGLVLHVSSQGVHLIRNILCDAIFRVPKDRIQVLTSDVGGGFGMKYFLYPEYPVLVWAAETLGRPVRWAADRSEAFITDIHARDHVTHAELALDAEARFVGMRVAKITNLGAYLSNYATAIATLAGAPTLASVYDNPAIYAEVQGVFTNTVPVDAYRGAGQPEAIYTVERLIDQAARELKLDRTELRRRNMIRPDQLPYRTSLAFSYAEGAEDEEGGVKTTSGWSGYLYDSGEFEQNLDLAMARADWDGFAARREVASAQGLLRGIGVASYLEATQPLAEDQAIIKVDPGGRVMVITGTQSQGQGHDATTFAQIVAEHLQVPEDVIALRQGDSTEIAAGEGSSGSRSMVFGGSAMTLAADQVIEQGRAVAAEMLEAAAVDIDYAEGAFTIRGTDRRIGLFDVAKERAGGGAELAAEGVFAPELLYSYPNDCHIAEVEIDPETGVIVVEAYTAIDDCGIVINPLIVAGQQQGGAAQGIGQALLEHAVYDEETGQLLSGSLMDYCLPRADDLPMFSCANNQVACRNNPLGVKGCGEVGPIAAPPAVVSAVLDALGPLGVLTIDMPLTPHRVWRAIQTARAG